MTASERSGLGGPDRDPGDGGSSTRIRGWEIRVPGEPLPTGRPRFVRATGRVYMPKETVAYQTAVRAAFQASGLPAFPPDEALYLIAHFWLPRPAAHWGTGRNAGKLKPRARARVTGRPDLDNLLKSILDGLNGHAFHDDGQVVKVSTEKFYVHEGNPDPHAIVSIISFG